MISDLSRLQHLLQYQFDDQALLRAAVTHRSVGEQNNERLEFLGDSVLGAVISRELYIRLPALAEGELSRMRAHLVRGETLTDIANELLLGRYLQLGAGERASGGRRRASILADAVEAVLGALYLEAGFETTREVILRVWQSRLDNLPTVDDLKDPKTRLQEWLQARSLPLPLYEVTEISGADHNQSFTVNAQCELASCNGKGQSRRKAEQQAAALLLEQLSEA